MGFDRAGAMPRERACALHVWQDGRWRKARVLEAGEDAVKVEATTGGGAGGEGDAGEAEWIPREEWPRRLFNR